MAASAGATEGRQARGLLKVMAAAGAMGTLGPVAALAYGEGVGPATFSALRAGIGAAILGVLAPVRPPAVRQPRPSPGWPAGPARPGRGRQRPDEPRPVLRLRGDGHRPGHGRLLLLPGAGGPDVRRPRSGAPDPGPDPVAGHRLCGPGARARQPARPRGPCDRRRHRPGRHRSHLPRHLPGHHPRRLRRRPRRPGHLARPRGGTGDLGHGGAPPVRGGRSRGSGWHHRRPGPRSCAQGRSGHCPRSG